MAAKKILTAARLRERLRYDPDTGEFYRFKKLAQRFERVGSPHIQGYIRICVDYGEYLAHRLAWLYMTGGWPKREIDHINGNKTDNRWINLRDVTTHQNGWNKGMMSTNTTGFTGVYYGKNCKGWRAQYNNKHLGVFVTKQEAYDAYLHARSIAQQPRTD